jgi:aspartate/methionine/tyrosine aminotransferase
VYFSRWEFAARHHLTASDAESMTLAELLALAGPEQRHAFDNLWLGYTQTWGMPELRDAIAGTYEQVSARDLLCFAGAEEGIYTAMRVLLEPGDHVIVATPNYQAAETLPLDTCEVSGWALDPARDWQPDLVQLEALLRPNTKLISINFPNNPTGCILRRETLNELVALCRKRGIWLFSDEVYRLIESDETLRLPQVADVYERGISLNVMSKAYGLPGLRIGWLACRDRGFLERCERYKHFLSICNAGPSEHLALIALNVRDRILERNRAIVRDNLSLLDAFFARWPRHFHWRRPDGGCVAYVDYLGADGVECFTRDLVEQAGVLLLPASVYRSEVGHAPGTYFRIGFGRLAVPQAVAALEQWLQQRP